MLVSPSEPCGKRSGSRFQQGPDHPACTRRSALQAGAIGLLGLGMSHLAAFPRWRVPFPSGSRQRLLARP